MTIQVLFRLAPEPTTRTFVLHRPVDLATLCQVERLFYRPVDLATLCQVERLFYRPVGLVTLCQVEHLFYRQVSLYPIHPLHPLDGVSLGANCILIGSNHEHCRYSTRCQWPV